MDITESRKQYYIDNKEKIKAKNRKYYHDNKLNGKYITVIIGLYISINILNKEAKTLYIKRINDYIIKVIRKIKNMYTL
jgi:hypothetical protein